MIWNAVFFVTGIVAGAMISIFLVIEPSTFKIPLTESHMVAYCTILPK